MCSRGKKMQSCNMQLFKSCVDALPLAAQPETALSESDLWVAVSLPESVCMRACACLSVCMCVSLCLGNGQRNELQMPDGLLE